MALFRLGTFKAASGRELPYKIECDVLGSVDWRCIAHASVKSMPSFGRVVPVPRGGVALATEFEQFILPGCRTLLVVDDVWTTGGSMVTVADDYMKRNKSMREWIGFAAFARERTPINVWAFCKVML